MWRKYLLALFLVLATFGRSDALRPPELVFETGSYGSGPGQFLYPSDIAADETGRIYIADGNNDRILVFDAATGRYISSSAHSCPRNVEFDPSVSGGRLYVNVENGMNGYRRDGGLDISVRGFEALGIAVGKDGFIYVSDFSRSRVLKISPSGQIVGVWGSEGYGDTEFYYPSGIGVDGDGNVYVMDYMRTIRKFTRDGVFIRRWELRGWARDSAEADISGTGPYPLSLAVDKNGRVYAEDDGFPARVVVFDSEGTELFSLATGRENDVESFGIGVDRTGGVYVGSTRLRPGPDDTIISEASLRKFQYPAPSPSAISLPFDDSTWPADETIIHHEGSEWHGIYAPSSQEILRYTLPEPRDGNTGNNYYVSGGFQRSDLFAVDFGSSVPGFRDGRSVVPVTAIADGTRVRSDRGSGSGYVLLRHDFPLVTEDNFVNSHTNEFWYSGYMHLTGIDPNKTEYACGEAIGIMSNVGTRAIHLHFAVYDEDGYSFSPLLLGERYVEAIEFAVLEDGDPFFKYPLRAADTEIPALQIETKYRTNKDPWYTSYRGDEEIPEPVPTPEPGPAPTPVPTPNPTPAPNPETPGSSGGCTASGVSWPYLLFAVSPALLRKRTK